jgi:prepilin-type N-terminal cleavage/methylation domain-containing protein
MQGRRTTTEALGQRGTARRAAFTLIELMVVIGIVVILIALVVPVIKSLRESNRLMTCASNMHAISVAIKSYTLDEGCPPTPYELNPADYSASATGVAGFGLHTLYSAGYIGRESTLHCPSQFNVKKSDPLYYHSYDSIDKLARVDASNPLGNMNQRKYLPYRGAADTDADYHRQLAHGTGTVPAYDRQWHPDDTAVVCWCDQHAQSFTRGGVGQYQVLFWGGNVETVPKTVMQGSGTDPTEAWRVKPQ